ncbi:hypothetical protein [Terrarubrum flagellatum]|uniref:hypothetical protein n=1 Tax=Terrirubrum flagellatum TaxID=2895980 RepID=UPI003145221F
MAAANAKGGNSTDPDFLAYTKVTHLELLNNWYGGGIRTTCNEFVCHAGIAMDAKMNLGQFEIASVLRTIGKGHAWVDASPTRRPQYGDVFRSVAFHMGVSLDCYGGGWWTVESGQGGPGAGCDILKRKIGFYNPASLRGWVDMELFLDPRPAVPEWLIGWWIIYEGLDVYYYHFDQYHNVAYAPIQPLYGTPANFVAVETVEFHNPKPDMVTIDWLGGTLETFTRDFNSVPGVMEKMTGITKPPYGGQKELRGVRL